MAAHCRLRCITPAGTQGEKGLDHMMMQNARDTGHKFDSVLQMYCSPPRKPDLTILQFLRWLCERGELEHQVFGLPAGVYSTDLDS